jgi:hypothetical protein
VDTANTGIEDVLNQVMWMSPLTDIINSIIAMGAAVVIGIVLLGIVQCFFGYKLFRVELAVIGAVGFGAATYLGCRFLLHYAGSKLILWTAFAAFMGAGMLYTVSAIIVFLVTLLGMTIGLMVANHAQGWDMLAQVIVVIAVAVALVAMLLYRHVIIVGNVVFGAGLIGLIMAGLFESAFFGGLIGCVFGVAGLITQYWMYIAGNRKRKAKEDAEEALEMAKKTKVISQEIPNVPSAESVSRTTATGAAVSVNPVLRAKAAAMDARQTEDVKTAATDTRRTQDRRATATNTHGTEGRRTTDTRRTERVNVTMPQPEETVNPQPATVSETGTITVGELRSKMKKV